MEIPFTPFIQAPPSLGNQYDDDALLRSWLARSLPPDVLKAVEPELRDLGALSGGELYRAQHEERLLEPVHTAFDPWGNRVDHIEVTPLWKRAERLAAERGVVAAAYEPRFGPLARLHQVALAYLFAPSTDIYACPLAMTDGAAWTLTKAGNAEVSARALPHLLSRDPKQFWTSGQWMTESTGGSDVALTETRAQKDADGTWRLFGKKWFTSATTSQMTLTLGRPEGNGPGGHGLALFYVETRDDRGRLRNIEVLRLKDKLGTRKVPTAELLLRGTPATPVIGLTDGIRNIAPMLNITRMWNAISAAALMRRGIALAKAYAKERVAFGARLSEKPLHLETLAAMQADLEATFAFTWKLGQLLGKDHARELPEEGQALLRVLTPLAKLTTGKQAVRVASEALECFGGAGYVEDTLLPVLLRDAQVLPIWEGTTNVLALDALKVLGKEGAPEALRGFVAHTAKRVTDPALKAAAERALADVDATLAFLRAAPARGPVLEAAARDVALCLGHAVERVLLAEHAEHAPEPFRAARRAAALTFDRRTPSGAPTQPALEDAKILLDS